MINTMTSFGHGTIETAALGRPFQLGMLYDCRKDVLIPGITLWDKNQLEKNTNVQQQNNTDFNITTLDSIEDKSNLLKISGSLKLSLLGGLVDVGGSAKYFKDTKRSQKQARVTLQYKTTTKFETLTMSHLARGKVSHPNVFEDNIATHVVTAILYGAGAYFLFDRESSSEDERKQIECELSLTCDKLKCLTVDVGASVALNMNDKEKSVVEKCKCTFHGDFQLPTNPTSFTDAVNVYRDLPKMLGENGEFAVPLKVWLYPLCKLDSKAGSLQRDISNDLIIYSSNIIESLTTAEMRCNDILKDTAASKFPAVGKKIQDLRQKCHHYKLNFMQKLGSVLPAIRGGGKEESVLLDLLNDHESSPFNSKELDQWLTNKEKESETIKSYLKQLQKLDAKMDANLDDLLADLDFRCVVCFSFTSLDEPDSFLAKLSNYLKPAGILNMSAESSDLLATNKDWLSTDIRQKVRGQMKLFGELLKMSNSADTLFIVASKYDKSHPGAGIYIYEDGSDEAVHFSPPLKPATPTTTDVSYDSITVQVSDPTDPVADSTPEFATVVYHVEYREKQNQETEWKSQPVLNQEAGTLSGLKSQTEYEIRVTAVGKLNYAVSSDVCSVTTTKRPDGTDTSEGTRCRSPQFQVSSVKIKMSPRCQDIVSKSGQIVFGCPAVYQLKPKKETVGTLTRMTVGEKSMSSINKTVLLVGETGTGKSTLINALVNHALGVRWENKVWYEIVERKIQEEGDQSESLTSDVIVYDVFGLENEPYSLTLIDTPGFGDTRGPKRNFIISQRLLELFQCENGLRELNVVALVLKASDNRLTDRLMYIFNSVMSLFGKDMVENIVALITNSNGLEPTCALHALKAAEVKCALNDNQEPLYFLFDNCQHKQRTQSTEDLLESSYKISAKAMVAFTAFLEKIQPQSLGETVEVLKRCNRLAACIQNLQERIVMMDTMQKKIKETQEALKKCEHEIKDNKIKTFEVYRDKCSVLGIRKFLFNQLRISAICCSVCKENCQHICKTDIEKSAVMENGNCTSCTGRCPVSDHEKANWIYVTKIRPIWRTKKEIKEKYFNKKQAVGSLKNLEEKMSDLQANRLKALEEAYKHVDELDKITLNVNSISTHVFFDFLIEKMEEKGDIEKVQRLRDMSSKQDKEIIEVLQYIYCSTYIIEQQ